MTNADKKIKDVFKKKIPKPGSDPRTSDKRAAVQFLLGRGGGGRVFVTTSPGQMLKSHCPHCHHH